jgi:hypothetical protein
MALEGLVLGASTLGCLHTMDNDADHCRTLVFLHVHSLSHQTAHNRYTHQVLASHTYLMNKSMRCLASSCRAAERLLLRGCPLS